MDVITGIQGVTTDAVTIARSLSGDPLGRVPVFDVSNAAADSTSLHFGDKLWNQVGNVSTHLDVMFSGGDKLSELRRSSFEAVQPTGDMALDMRNASLAQSEAMMKVAELQTNVTRGQAIFSIAMGMVQSVQGGVRTLFQDK